MNNNFVVSIRCISYNHAAYIKDCMSGFVMQETSFPYVCVIDDDASTDGEPEVIRKYMAEHFNMDDKTVVRSDETSDYKMIFAQHKTNKNCFFAVYYLKYNHYSIRKSREDYVAKYVDGSKYWAICEGDDYWIDPLKLQKQVDYLENHPECTMVCNRTYLFSEKRKRFVGESYCYNHSQYADVKDIICRGGLFLTTCSLLFRKSIIKNDYPEYWRNCHVGDYPLQIAAAMKGKVYYINDVMSVYRIENNASWLGQRKKINIKKRISTVKSEVDMLNGFAKDYPQYSHYFQQRVWAYINKNFPDRKCPVAEQHEYLDAFEDEIKFLPFIWKVDLFIRKLRIIGLMHIYPFASLCSFKEKRKKY